MDFHEETRLTDYKSRPPLKTQENRRIELLQEQKEKRQECFDSNRPLESFIIRQESKKNKKGYGFSSRIRKVRKLLMLSEWMLDVPIDLEEKWLFVPCPVGKRCTIVAADGSTYVYSKSGQWMMTFKSALPNGNKISKNRKGSEITILDCIYYHLTETFYILDILGWKGFSSMEYDTNFRFYWLKSKVEETPEILEVSPINEHRILPLDFYPSDSETVSTVLSKYPIFPDDSPQVDGILFYHCETSYITGITPLVGWLKPFMILEVLGPNFVISEDFANSRPDSYISARKYADEFDKDHKRNRKKSDIPDAVMESIELEQS